MKKKQKKRNRKSKKYKESKCTFFEKFKKSNINLLVPSEIPKWLLNPIEE